ncbi:MAG TPA: alpha/beta hydrolase [Solirubrobacteraceae bacterium]|nr:alpha/beta hydrolase [Solirubrobacteraceae bacterium]
MKRLRLLRDLLLVRGRSYSYGHHSSQRADLHLPAGPGLHPVMVLIHGGSWRARYSKVVMRALARDLVGRGWAVWNIEYRRLGEGGGWPATFEDVAAAIDLLPDVHPSLDMTRVSVLGHSAGGHLALWAAGRGAIAHGQPGAAPARPRVTVRRVVAMAPVADLARAYRDWHGGAVRELMGGSPERLPDRYAAGDPVRLLPVPMPVLIVHGVLDEVVAIGISRSYAEAAEAVGADVRLVEIAGAAGRHRAHIYPGGATWDAVTGWLERASEAASR